MHPRPLLLFYLREETPMPADLTCRRYPWPWPVQDVHHSNTNVWMTSWSHVPCNEVFGKIYPCMEDMNIWVTDNVSEIWWITNGWHQGVPSFHPYHARGILLSLSPHGGGNWHSCEIQERIYVRQHVDGTVTFWWPKTPNSKNRVINYILGLEGPHEKCNLLLSEEWKGHCILMGNVGQGCKLCWGEGGCWGWLHPNKEK